MKSFRTRITITIMLVVLGSSALLSFISYQRAKTSLITQMEDNYAVAAQKYALELTSWISTNATIIDTMAAEIAVNDISAKSYDEFHRYLKNSNELLNKNGYVYDVYFTYPDNFMVCASDFMADGSVDFVHEREWYTTSALTGELFYASPYLDSDTNKPIITISKAVYEDSRLLGVLAADIFVDVLVDMINNADVGENSYAFMIDQSMRMIVHPDPAYDYVDTPHAVTDIPGAPYGTLVNSIRSDIDGMVFVKDYDGVERGIAFSRMPNTGWYVCIATSRDELAEEVGSLLRGFVIATGISMVIGAVIAVFLASVLDKAGKQEQEYKQQVLKLEKQAADEASKAKSRFLADMSHEIRTPINAIIGMNEMILRESDDGDIRAYSQNIKQSGHNLLQLINGILDFSKIEDGKMEIVPVRYHVGSQIAYFINSISDRANSKNLQMIYDIDPKLPSVLYGDDTRINQVVMNLLTNAVKYTETGSVTLSVRVAEGNTFGSAEAGLSGDSSADQSEASSADQSEASSACLPEDSSATPSGSFETPEVLLHYEVRDTGIGIKENEMARLFESFERLDVVRNRNIEGTGLGMAITCNLLGLMGSELKVESEYGTGSTFSFDLKQKVEDAHPLGDFRKAIEEVRETDVYRESFHAPDALILVVDDTKMNITVVKNLLKQTGVRIDYALNGYDATDLACEKKYDVILMDQRMSGMDGSEAMKLIRTSSGSKNTETPEICLTADVITGARERYLAMGFNDYLTKPVDGIELEKMLIRHLPKEKVEIVTIKKAVPADMSGGRLFDALEDIGVNTEIGMELCDNDISIYKDVLGSFAKEEMQKSANIRKCFKAGNWKDYRTYIHALKSSSKTLGALGLSDLAAAAESAAVSENTADIEQYHDRILDKYATLAEAIIDNIEPEYLEGDDENEVIEF